MAGSWDEKNTVSLCDTTMASHSQNSSRSRAKASGVLSNVTSASHGFGKHGYKTRCGLHIPLPVTFLGQKKTEPPVWHEVGTKASDGKVTDVDPLSSLGCVRRYD